MKILIDHNCPFFLAHGGFQIQMEQTKAALQARGLEAEYVRWWDTEQQGDVIHYFGRPIGSYVQLAQQKGIKVVISELMSGQGARSRGALAGQTMIMRTLRRLLPGVWSYRLGWDSFRLADACIGLTSWEASLMQMLYSPKPDRVHVVSNGVEKVFLEAPAGPPPERGQWLVCTATVTPVKRMLEMAEAAVLARAPFWVVGRPYSATDPYFLRFQELAARHPEVIRYEGGISDRARLALVYRQARGFVLLSAMESQSLSACEAAACGCPLLLSDLPWARCTFGSAATYCPVTSVPETAEVMQRFYRMAPTLPAPPRPPGWAEVAASLEQIYASLLRGPSPAAG